MAAAAEAGVREGRPAARRPRGAPARAGEAGRRPRRRHRRRRRRLRRRTSWRPPSRSSTSAAAGSAASAAGSSTRSRRSPPASWSSSSCSRSTAASTSRPASARRGRPCPARCWCPSCRTTPTSTPSCSRSCAAAGSRCGCPQRGDKRSLLETVERNAKEAFARHRVKRASDLTARSLALSELQEALELPDAPLRIECIDVSHVQGTNVVASMVVFEDGLAKKSDYRRFSVAPRAPTTPPPWPRWCAAGSPATSRRRRTAGTSRGRRRGGPAAPVRLPAEPAGGRRRRAPGGRGQPVARRSSASSTSPSAGWPSAWRRSGCPATATR